MPMVVAMLKRVTGRELDRSISPDESVRTALLCMPVRFRWGSRLRRPIPLQVGQRQFYSLGIIGIESINN